MLSLQGEHTLLQTEGSLEPMVSMARWLLRLKVKILAILRLTVNIFVRSNH